MTLALLGDALVVLNQSLVEIEPLGERVLSMRVVPWVSALHASVLCCVVSCQHKCVHVRGNRLGHCWVHIGAKM